MTSVSFPRFPPNICLEVSSLMRGYEIPRKEWIALLQQQMHMYSYIAIFMTVNSTHLTVGGSKVTKITQNYIQLC